MNPVAAAWLWVLAAVVGSAAVYGPADYNLLIDSTIATPCTGNHPSLVDRVMFNGFAKIAWSLAVSWVVVACVKKHGGVINTFLSWSVWVPLARVQYCVYLLHR